MIPCGKAPSLRESLVTFWLQVGVLGRLQVFQKRRSRRRTVPLPPKLRGTIRRDEGLNRRRGRYRA